MKKKTLLSIEGILSFLFPLFLISCGVYDGDDDISGLKGGVYSASEMAAGDGMSPSLGGDQFGEFNDNPFISTAEEPTSTFSVDADGASYCIIRNYLDRGFNINPNSVRIEEMLNYFTFDYPEPTGSHTAAINAEATKCPWNEGHVLLRLGIKGKSLAASEMPQANFVFLIDVSGSMSSSDKLDLLKSGLKELVTKLKPDDRISIITYSGEVEKLLESTKVKNASKIIKAIDKLRAEGCTNGGDALKMAYQEAQANYDPKANNRIIMGTDGDFNVGVTSTSALVEMVESYAKKGIYMTCLGFGMGNLNDIMMEQISNKGNGTYHFIDSEEEMMKVFVHERERFVAVANDAKCQVTFNPDVVESYRLIGYENRVMNNRDFEDDSKDAGEIGAGQTITALYELVPTANSQQLTANSLTMATFDFRYKKTLNDDSLPLKVTVTADEPYNKITVSQNMKLAEGIAAFGMVMRKSEHKGTATLDMAHDLVKQSLAFDPQGRRAELLKLIEKSK